MANSKYEYVRDFEQDDRLLPNTFIVVRLDGKGFHRFTARVGFGKPNDRRALDLMNAAAIACMKEISDICVAYGVSDEYSFVLRRDCSLFERRASKLMTLLVSTFTAYYVYLWPDHFPGISLSPPLPTFDGRAVCYPSLKNLLDYMSWRQVDCHINNLYNTTFWALVHQGGRSTQEAEIELQGTLAKDKNEILFSQFGINYNKESEIFKKGSVVSRTPKVAETDRGSVVPDDMGTGRENEELSKSQKLRMEKDKKKARIVVEHVDIIRPDFWRERPWVLGINMN